MTTVSENIELTAPGFVPCLGGGELLQATKTLFGATKSSQSHESVERPFGPKPVKPMALKHLTLETEDDPQTRELLVSIQRFANLASRRSATFDDKYHYGLLLQELAAKLRYEIESKGRVLPVSHVTELLTLAGVMYEEALELKPKFHAALYNWGVALSELSSLWKTENSQKARRCLHLASQKYAESLSECSNNPRGLNNWGLVLQEVSNYELDPARRIRLAIQAIDKFRQSVRFQLDFDHGCYNMGTIYYTHAIHMRDSIKNATVPEYTDSEGRLVGPLQELTGLEKGVEDAANAMMRTAAQYICLAAAIQPSSTVYQSSVNIVKHVLPRPYLRVGHLTVARFRSLGKVKEAWERQWFVLDAVRFASGIGRHYIGGGSYVPPKNREKGEPGPDHYCIDVKDVITVDRCNDLALPEGFAFWIQTRTHPEGLYFLSGEAESADAWVDSLKLCGYVSEVNRTQGLTEMLGP